MSRKLMPHPVDIHGFFLSQILRCPILFLRDFIHYFRKKVVLFPIFNIEVLFFQDLNYEDCTSILMYSLLSGFE